VRHAAVAPLRAEEPLELAEGAIRIDVRKADGDERAIPAPLVRVEARRRPRPPADVVRAQHRDGSVPELARPESSVRCRELR
jgi:hypothetical protein